MTLEEYLAANHHLVGAFAPGVRYSRDGDFWECSLENVSCFGRQIDGWLTLMHAQDDERIVGWKLRGASALPRSEEPESGGA